MITKKGYFVSENDEFGIAVVAPTAKAAKKIGYHHLQSEYASDASWTDVRVKFKKNANVGDLPVGIIEDNLRALKEGIFSWIEGEDCPVCGGSDVMVSNDEGFVGCDDCIEKHQEDTASTPPGAKEAFS